MEAFIIVPAVSILAGLIQGITGFGSCIVILFALPYFYTLSQSAGIATAVTIALCAAMVVKYRKTVRVREALLPSALYLTVSSFVIHFAAGADEELLKKIFGFFLIVLSAYYLFVKKRKSEKKLPLPVDVLFIVASAVCDGLFGIGGPLMVLYFLSRTKDKEEYLGTIHLFFLVNTVYNTGFRVYKGILTAEHFPVILLGVAGILLGFFVAGKLVDRLNAKAMSRLTYVMIGVSGVLNLV
ncbi:MAG: sulfite exporter TauE/SafE family protein [Clostridia bacterium]|nr:sulfite exporter TauE/SafE family protein [Clostridia bacterium]